MANNNNHNVQSTKVHNVANEVCGCRLCYPEKDGREAGKKGGRERRGKKQRFQNRMEREGKEIRRNIFYLANER